MISFKHLSRKPFIHTCLSYIAAFYIRFVYYTSRWHVIGEEIPKKYWQENKPFITCFWHGRLFMLCYAWRTKAQDFYMLNSPHPDGQLIAKTVAQFGIKPITGSTTHQGIKALRQILAHLKKGHAVGITPDGPKGPREQVTAGLITIARLAQVDIVPVTFSVKRAKVLKTWDRFMIALPFTKGIFVWGNPIAPIAAEDKAGDLLETQLKVKAEIDRITRLADDSTQSVFSLKQSS